EIDTDKVTQEVESDFAGVLLKIGLAAGEAPVGQTIAWIGEPGEEIAAAPAPASAPASAPEAPDPAPAERASDPVPGTVTAQADTNGARVKASPLARRLARERGIDLATLRGTGPEGRIVAEDVERGTVARPPAAAPAAVGEVERIPLTNVRKTIARRLSAAWQAPVFQLTVSADMMRANALVTKARALNPDVRITVTDVLAKVCASALMRHRDVNVAFDEDALLRFPSANVGIAVAAPQGLVVPVLRSVERQSLAEVARGRGEIVERARANQLRSADLDGGTFTISNLGMFGIEQFVAVLNPPQAAILAVGSTEDRAVALDGEVVVRPTMTMTLTVDHRAVDGAEGADFLRTVKQFLEEPALAL
ncbi:MAG TPA: dihydrolipoamide acetyltransferase family protein, partial [Candidatus Baltobacteraceae bacterium]|nr:dihydrolipoamide acetyltransferase family protein [Candidatus Baltobacteraceae bacterium]